MAFSEKRNLDGGNRPKDISYTDAMIALMRKGIEGMTRLEKDTFLTGTKDGGKFTAFSNSETKARD